MRKTLASVAATATLLVVTAGAAYAQDARFDVASIKANKSGARQNRFSLEPGGHLVVFNMNLETLIRFAYGDPLPLQPNRLSFSAQWIGGGDFLASDHFDIEARIDAAADQAKLQAALRALLAERFNLVVHHEVRERPTYALLLAHPDGRLGAALRRSDINCADPGAQPATLPNGEPSCGFSTFPGRFAGRVTMPVLARALTGFVDDHRPVEDQTRLTGTFDVKLEWTPSGPVAARPPDAPPAPPIDPNGPALFTALKEQLGLSLDARKDQIDVIVVDRAEHPTED